MINDLSKALCCLLLLMGIGCSGPDLPRGLSLRDAATVKDPKDTGLWFPRAPEIVPFTFEGERRTAVLASIDPWRWTGKVPAGAALHAGVQLLPEAWQAIRSLQAWVVAKSDGETEVLEVVRTNERQSPRWIDFTADLSRWAGREVTLEFHATLDGLPPEHRHSNLVAWGPVRVSARETPEDVERPNILFILVDTLRFDHLTPYGYPRPTSPEIARTLATPGVVVEEAYSQAPWTLPSVASFMTSRYPGEILGDDPGTYGIPEKVESLPETLEKLGYETGGFFANKVLHEGNGFARGFRTFYSPPSRPGLEAQGQGQPDAAELTGRVLPWLTAHRDGPFFLYVHYVDPHDPYENPEIVNNRSPFEPPSPPYTGPLTGRHVHGVYTGKIPLEDPEKDTEHLKALYDSEIHYVDGFVGRLIDAIPPEVLENTLVVLTADHGEEFREHGGWKHGFTLYEDQIHVPLLVRWDKRIPAGSRLRGTVRLIDLVPTLVNAAGGAGGKASPAWEGVDVLPALTGKAPLPRLAAFAQHMMIGPLRAAAVLDRKKLILFNPRTPYTPGDELQAHLWTQDLARLKRVEMYDLARDAKEKSNLAPASPGQVGQLQPLIHHQLDRQMPGLRVFASGFPAGSRLQGSIVLARPPARWVSYFLAEEDHVELAGNRVSFDLGGDTIEKGFLLEGDSGSIQAVEARLNGQPLPSGQILVGREGAPAAKGPALRLWSPNRRRPPSASSNPETEKRLQALGYAQ